MHTRMHACTWLSLYKSKGVTPITHSTQVCNVKKIENSSIDLVRGQNSWSKSCKFHCFIINFAEKKTSKTPSNSALRGAQIASTGILDAKIFSGEAPWTPATRGGHPLSCSPPLAPSPLEKKILVTPL